MRCQAVIPRGTTKPYLTRTIIYDSTPPTFSTTQVTEAALRCGRCVNCSGVIDLHSTPTSPEPIYTVQPSNAFLTTGDRSRSATWSFCEMFRACSIYSPNAFPPNAYMRFSFPTASTKAGDRKRAAEARMRRGRVVIFFGRDKFAS